MSLALAACLGVGIAAAEGPAQHPPEFRSSVEAVYVDVFVTRDGRPVPGLEASSFEVKDNGVRQSVKRVAAESVPLHAVLVFDTSSSLSGPRLHALKAAGDAFLAGLRPSDEVALVGFSEEVAWLAASTARRRRGRTRAGGASTGRGPPAGRPRSAASSPAVRCRRERAARSSSCSRTARTTRASSARSSSRPRWSARTRSCTPWGGTSG